MSIGNVLAAIRDPGSPAPSDVDLTLLWEAFTYEQAQASALHKAARSLLSELEPLGDARLELAARELVVACLRYEERVP